MHIVTFDSQGKIQQIRQAWDQGSLLKQLDVIGKSGRNWPIRDSTEQIRLLETCVKSSSSNGASSRDPNDLAVRSRGNSTNAFRDPHASLALFAPRDESDESIESVISPRGGARPRQRDFAEILGDEPVDSPGRERSESPSKAMAPKAGGDKKFQPSRLFERDGIEEESDSPEAAASPSKFIRPNPKKYTHFDFGDGSDKPQDVPQTVDPTPQQTKHASQWSFDDFVTPQKVKPTKVLRQQEVRHWSTEENDVQESPVRKAAPPKPRRDAETHFEFVDDGPDGEPRAARPRGSTHNNGLGLYKNNVHSEHPATTPTGEVKALGAITNLKDRGRDFESHWDMTDDSPAGKSQSKPALGDNHKKAVKMMDANWSSYDQSPVQKENKPVAAFKHTDGERGIHIGGDGMGGSKGTNRDWLFGGEDDEPVAKPVAPKGRTAGAKSAAGGFSWDF